MNTKGKIASALLAALLLAACGSGSGIDGTYTAGLTSYTFESGGKVEVSTMGATVEMHYEVEDGKVKMGPKGGPVQVMTIEKDGSLSLAGPVPIKLTKKK